jgi:transposase InsO family protein
MKGQTGAQLTIHSALRPAFSSLPIPLHLSKDAKLRLQWIDYYHKRRDVSLTCRHFGIGRSLFYKWKNRYDRLGPKGLEEVSKRPARVRTPTTPTVHVDLIRTLRRAHPEYSKYKLRVILERDHGVTLSDSTIGRVITRYKLFFTRPVKPKGHPQRRAAARKRLPKGLVGIRPGELVEVDVKHLPFADKTRYAFVTIDRATRRTSIHVSSTISSTQGAAAWRKAVADLGLTSPSVLTDNGSENLGAFAKLLQNENIPHYFARPRTPKDKPYVERVIGTLERECLQWGGVGYNVADQQELIDAWLAKYHSFRPHQALGYLTPDAYASRLEGEVSTML